MGRSIKKGPYVPTHLQKKVKAMNAADQNTVIKTWARNATITPDFLGLTFAVLSGLVYDGRLVVDANFQTTDAHIFAGGPLCQFSRK